jgi:hypothetical protein
VNLYYRLKWKIKDSWWHFRKRCQRFKRGYAYVDVWDMDQWFMEIVKPMLIHLRTHGNSFPFGFNNRDEWCSVLDEMINCLDFMNEDSVLHFLGFVEVDYWKRMNNEDRKHVSEIMNNNKNRFFELFNKYFYDLWD